MRGNGGAEQQRQCMQMEYATSTSIHEWLDVSLINSYVTPGYMSALRDHAALDLM